MLARLHPAGALGLGLALGACGGGGGDDAVGPAVGAASARQASLAGLYVLAPETGGESYLEIGADGDLTAWSYLGDTGEAPQNCHFRVGPTDLVPLGDDVYALRAPDAVYDAGPDATLTMYRDGDELVGVFVDEDDEDGDGDVTETIEQRLPLASGLSATDFEACTDEQVERWFEGLAVGTPVGTFADPVSPARVFGLDLGAPAS